MLPDSQEQKPIVKKKPKPQKKPVVKKLTPPKRKVKPPQPKPEEEKQELVPQPVIQEEQVVAWSKEEMEAQNIAKILKASQAQAFQKTVVLTITVLAGALLVMFAPQLSGWLLTE